MTSPMLRVHRAVWLGALVCVGAMVGCSSSVPVPEVRNILPDSGYNGTETTITVIGANFFPTVSIDASERGQADFDAQFEIALANDGGSFSLTGVDLLDYGTLEADVPEGLLVGTYDVVVTAPSGLEASGQGMFRVTDTRADSLVFEPATDTDDGTSNEFLVGELARLPFKLLDNEGSPVSEALDVVVTADAGEVTGVTFEDRGALNNFAVDGDTVSGRLLSDGTGAVWVSADAVDSVEFTVEPADPDSWINSDNIDYDFYVTDLYNVIIELPGEGFVATAGEAFAIELTALDEGGGTLKEELSLSLDESCGNTPAGDVLLTGNGVTQVTVTHATAPECDYTELKAYLSRPDVAGVSVPFTVLPAALAEFVVDVFPQDASATEIVAGVTGLIVEIEPVDAYGNVIFDYSGVLHLSDSLGELGLDAEPGDGTCGLQNPTTGKIFCNILLTGAGETVVLTVTDRDTSSILGESAAFEVIPDVPSLLSLAIMLGEPAIAGDPYKVIITAFDSWDNEAEIELSTDYFLSVDDDIGGTTCEEPSRVSGGVFRLNCQSTVAGDRLVTARLAPVDTSLSTLDSDEALTVLNGQLAALVLDAAPSAVAGEPFLLEVSAEDQWGNPYEEAHSGRDIVLEDSSGTIFPTLLTLDTTGFGSTNAVITESNKAAVIYGLQGGVSMGAITLAVTHAELHHLTVTPEADWSWLNEPLGVGISARDEYENLVEDYSELVTVSSTEDGFIDRNIQVSGGEVAASIIWTSAVLQDVITAEGSSAEGSGTPVDALDADCDDGPVASLILDSAAEAVSCIDAAGDAEVEAELDASAGDAPLEALYFGTLGGEQARIGAVGLPSHRLLTSTDTGAFVIELVAFDSAACGGRSTALWWVAEDDGGPAGAVLLEADASSLIVSDPSAVATVTVSAWSCTGDSAALGSEVLVRADLGTVQTAASTGAGLAVTLNMGGQGSFEVSAADTLHGGDALVAVGRADGSAYGELTLEMTGDNALPYVVDAWPTGAIDGPVDELSVSLSEPLNPLLEIVDGEEIALEGPSGPVAIEEFEIDGNLITLQVDELDVSDGVYTLTLVGGTLSASIVDRAGNRLDGTYSGSPSDYTVRFGAAGDEGILVSECLRSTEVFFPDGDDGAKKEVDEVSFDVKASATPVWWQLEVLDASGALVRFHRYPATGDSDSLVWDGRGDSGEVLDAGAWTVHVRAVDSTDNVSDACAAQVELGQHLQRPE